MAKELGESMLFTGGAEPTSEVAVVQYHCPGLFKNGNKTLQTLQISQGKNVMILSPETMECILEWYNEE